MSAFALILRAPALLQGTQEADSAGARSAPGGRDSAKAKRSVAKRDDDDDDDDLRPTGSIIARILPFFMPRPVAAGAC